MKTNPSILEAFMRVDFPFVLDYHSKITCQRYTIEFVREIKQSSQTGKRHYLTFGNNPVLDKLLDKLIMNSDV
jgi:hypothetical protein